MHLFSRWGLAAVAAALLTSAASAASLISPSVANIAGTVTVNEGGVFFSNLSLQAPEIGSFAGTTGVLLQDLTGAPRTGAVDIPQFATFLNPNGNVSFDLQTIYPGVGSTGACSSNTVGNICTVANSPFTLVQLAPGQVSISLALSGIAYTDSAASGSSMAPFSFTSQNTMPGTITGILAAAESPAGFTNSFSATISASSVPEPASYLLMGMGLTAAGLIARRRSRQ